jgi:hypothetical protein
MGTPLLSSAIFGHNEHTWTYSLLFQSRRDRGFHSSFLEMKDYAIRMAEEINVGRDGARGWKLFQL